MSLPHTFTILNVLYNVEKLFLIYRHRSLNDNIYVHSFKIIYAIASTVLFISVIIICYFTGYFKDIAFGSYEANLLYMVMQVIEYYLIIVVAYLYRSRQLKMDIKIKNIFKLLPTQHNSNFKQWKYTASIFVWQLISFFYFFITFFAINTVVSENNIWAYNLVSYWYTLTKLTHDSNIIGCTFTYLNISEAIFRMDYVIKKVIIKYRSLENSKYKKTVIDEKHVCNEINVLIKLYDEIYECTEDANKIFGITVSPYVNPY